MFPNRFIPSILSVFGLSLRLNQCPTIQKQTYPKCDEYLQRDFDFIIVGSGPGGCALANRLSENPDWNVLMVEAGGYPSKASEIPAAAQFLLGTSENWKFLSEPLNYPTAHLDNRIHLPQGKALGGSSTINGLLDVPGQAFDYNLWADLVKNDIWNWTNVEPYITKSSQYLKTTNPVVLTNGRMKIESAARELGLDINGPTPFGFHDEPMNVVNNVRLSMAKAYLQPLIKRKNFCLVVDTFVNRVVIDPKTNRAVGIEFNNGYYRPKIINATKEVIVSAGPINSPKLLMLSGLGPKDHLKKIGIPLIQNLPVGKNLQDHYHVPIFLQIQDISQIPINKILTVYCSTGQLLNNDGIVSFIGFFNTHHFKNRSCKDKNDTTLWVTTPRDIELITTQGFQNEGLVIDTYLNGAHFHPKYNKRLREINSKVGWLMTLVTLLHPKSKGTVELKNKNPKEPPLIQLNYFDHPDDMKTMMKGIGIYLRLKNTKSLRNYRLSNLKVEPCDKFRFMSKEYFKCYSRMFVTTTFHYAGTCRMGSDPVKSVVDPTLRVHGVPNLRVCDSSIIPELMGGHPSVPTAIVGEKLADIIKDTYLSVE